jgi:hypothetical protein
MVRVYVLFGVLLALLCITESKEIPLPLFMKEVPSADKAKFVDLITRDDLQPAQRRQMIDQFISTQSSAVQKSYQQYNQLLEAVGIPSNWG